MGIGFSMLMPSLVSLAVMNFCSSALSSAFFPLTFTLFFRTVAISVTAVSGFDWTLGFVGPFPRGHESSGLPVWGCPPLESGPLTSFWGSLLGTLASLPFWVAGAWLRMRSFVVP